MSRSRLLAIAVALVLGCVSYTKTLRNDKGETIVCEAAGCGTVSSGFAQGTYNNCLTTARRQGFSEANP